MSEEADFSAGFSTRFLDSSLIMMFGSLVSGCYCNCHCYSDLRLFIGFANAALMDWKLTVIKAIRIAANPANTHIQYQFIGAL